MCRSIRQRGCWNNPQWSRHFTACHSIQVLGHLPRSNGITGLLVNAACKNMILDAAFSDKSTSLMQRSCQLYQKTRESRGFQLHACACRPGEAQAVNGHGAAAAAPQPLVLPNGQVLTQIAPLTPEQLAELAHNTQLKNQLYAQLLYRSMAQASPGQAPMQLHHLLNLSPQLMAPGAAPQQHANLSAPLMGLPTGELVQNLLVMPDAQTQASAPAAQPNPKVQPQPSASPQQSSSPAFQSQSLAASMQPVSAEAAAVGMPAAKGSGEKQMAAAEGNAHDAALGAAERIDQSPALGDPDEVKQSSAKRKAAAPAQ